MKEAAELYLSLPVSDRRSWNRLARKGLDPEEIDNQMLVVVGMTDAAAAGDARAAKVLIDILGESTQTDESAALAKAKELLEGVESVIE